MEANELSTLVAAAVAEARQQTEQRQQVANRRLASTPGRQRWMAAAVVVTIPVLVASLMSVVTGRSLAEIVAPGPTVAEARVQAGEAVSFVTSELRGYHDDFGYLPLTLTEVGAPNVGEWQYAPAADGHFQIAVTVGGRTTAFDSRRPGGGK